MSNNFIKSTGKTSADLARKIANQMAREPVEILKSAVPSHLQEKDKPYEVQEITASDETPKKPDIDEEVINSQANKRLQELEQEIEKIRQERRLKEEEWIKKQQAQMGVNKPKSQEQVFIEPQGKKKRGFMGFMKKKQGTKEMGKQISG